MNAFADAINFIFNEHESPAGGAQVGGLANLWELMWPHLKMSGVAMAALIYWLRRRTRLPYTPLF